MSALPSINSILNAGATGSAGSVGSNSTSSAAPTISQSQFFQLLLAQMQNQDPLQPMDSSDFVTQLSQFSQLQSSQQLNTTLTNFVTQQGMSQGAALIGKTVSYDPGTGVLAKGTVDSVNVDNTGNVTLAIGSQSVTLSQIRTITSPKASAAAASAATNAPGSAT